MSSTCAHVERLDILIVRPAQQPEWQRAPRHRLRNASSVVFKGGSGRKRSLSEAGSAGAGTGAPAEEELVYSQNSQLNDAALAAHEIKHEQQQHGSSSNEAPEIFRSPSY